DGQMLQQPSQDRQLPVSRFPFPVSRFQLLSDPPPLAPTRYRFPLALRARRAKEGFPLSVLGFVPRPHGRRSRLPFTVSRFPFGCERTFRARAFIPRFPFPVSSFQLLSAPYVSRFC